MHVGMCQLFQAHGLDITDAELFKGELALASMAEGLGFDSVWTPEHHFTDHGLTPNVPQFLSWVAGRTSTVKLGTMVTILPWHDPVRVCEAFTLLDHFSDGRAILGIGRGLGRVEFDGFRVPMGESRGRFAEYTKAILVALKSGFLEFDGEFYQQPRLEIRPRPLTSFQGRTFASAVSPSTIDLMAQLGVGLMIVPQKPWEVMDRELLDYANRFRELNGVEAPKPVVSLNVAVHETVEGAQEMYDRYLLGLSESNMKHYEFDNPEFASIEGYEYYGALSKNIAKHGKDAFNRFLADLQVWGTPEQVTAKILDIVKRTDAGGLISITSFGGMPPEVARASTELYAREVLPVLHTHDVGGDIGVRHSPDSYGRSPASSSSGDDLIVPVI